MKYRELVSNSENNEKYRRDEKILIERAKLETNNIEKVQPSMMHSQLIYTVERERATNLKGIKLCKITIVHEQM